MGRFAKAAKNARELTNKQLADEIVALTPFDRTRLRDLLPKQRDRVAFLELMREVEAETEMDIKLGYLRDNLQTAGSVVFKVLKFLM